MVPALNAAIAGIRSLKRTDMKELSTLLTPAPPEKLQKILEAVCILRGVKPAPQEVDNILNDSLLWIINFDRENVSEEVLTKLKKYIINPEFTPNGLEIKSAKWLCSWVISVYKYAQAFKTVQPKKAKLASAYAQLQGMCCLALMM